MSKSKSQKGFTQHHFQGGKLSFNFKKFKSGAGFTLVELLVVIAIIGILASMSTVSVNIARERARDAKRKADVSQVQLALYFYFDDNLRFPLTTASYGDPIPADLEQAALDWDSILKPSLDGTATGELYMGLPPTDSLNFDPYVYGYTSNGEEFIINYYLESGGPRDLHGY